MLGVVLLYLFINSIFSVLAAPAVLRYQIFGMIVWLSFAVVLMEISLVKTKKWWLRLLFLSSVDQPDNIT